MWRSDCIPDEGVFVVAEIVDGRIVNLYDGYCMSDGYSYGMGGRKWRWTHWMYYEEFRRALESLPIV